MKNIVKISVRGPVGCGKSAIAHEILGAMRALGLEAKMDNVGAYDVSGDAIDSLEIYRDNIRVEIVEQLHTEHMIEKSVGGAYEMPDGRQFWIDSPVAKEITRRVLEASA